MSSLQTYLQNEAFDADIRASASPAWASNRTTLRISQGLNRSETWLAFALDIPRGASILSATLQVRPAANSADTVVSLLAFRGDTNPDLSGDVTPVLEYLDELAPATGAWTADVPVSFDIASLVAACVAHASFARGDYLYLNFYPVTSVVKTLHAYEAVPTASLLQVEYAATSQSDSAAGLPGQRIGLGVSGRRERIGSI